MVNTTGSKKATGCWIACIAFVAALIGPLGAQAKTNDLDEGFGEGGRAATAADLGGSWRNAEVRLATGPEGSTVVASDRQLIRYLPDGQLDPGFGEGGKVTLEEVEGLPFTFGDVTIDGEGRVVAFGTAVDPNTSFMIPFYFAGGLVHPTFVVVLRYDATGRLDPSFGAGDGVVRTDFGLPPNLHAERGSPPPLVRLVAGAVDSQERPVLVAALEELAPVVHSSVLIWSSSVVARLTATGAPDPTFGGGGVIVLSSDQNRGLAIGPDSEPLLVWGDPLSATQVTRLRGDGTADGNYGTAGMRTIRGGGGAAVLDRFGRLLVLDRPGKGPVHVLRLEPDGSLDRTFGRDGRATVRPPGKGAALSAIAVDARGRALVVGTRMRPGRLLTPRFVQPREFFIVGRLRAAGQTDRRFGHQGWISTGFGRHSKIAAPQEVLAPQGWDIAGPQAVLDRLGHLVVASAAHSPQLQPGGIVLARYLVGG